MASSSADSDLHAASLEAAQYGSTASVGAALALDFHQVQQYGTAHTGSHEVTPPLTPKSSGRQPLNPLTGQHPRVRSTSLDAQGQGPGSRPPLSRTTTSYAHIEDPDLHEYEEIEATAYSGAMATIIKDVQRMSIGTDHFLERTLRIAFAVFVLIGLIGIQVYVLVTIKTFVTSPAVRSIRQVYDEYQKIMYHGHVQDSGYGVLGIGGPTGQYFDPTQFSKVSDDLKGSVCIIPFSQPAYLAMILFIWSLGVIGELKICLSLALWLRKAETIPLDQASIVEKGDVDVIRGMPMVMKIIMFALVILPRLLTTLLLFWLGCRWLAATLDMTEVLINAIALQFVIHLNSLLYDQLVSDRSKRELSNLRLDMRHVKGAPPSVPQYVGSMGWAIVAVAWVYLYLHFFQLVIPGYQWDVRGPCGPWVAERFNFWRI